MSRSLKDDSQSLFFLSLLGIFTSPIWLLILVGLALPVLLGFFPVVMTALWALFWIKRSFVYLLGRG